jgi:hypothetical protein
MLKSCWVDEYDKEASLKFCIDVFKEDYLLNFEWLNEREILKEYIILFENDFHNREATNMWGESFTWILSRKEWRKKGFLYLLKNEKLAIIRN